MSKRLFLLTAITAISFTSKAQVKIAIQVHQPIGSMAKLFRYEGKTQIEIDSCRPNPDGIYVFKLSSASPKGIYKLTIGKGSSFDFIVSTDTIVSFETYSFAIEDSLKVKQSAENEVFINFRKIRQKAEQKMWLIESLRKYYTEPTMFSQMLENEHQRTAFDLYMQGNALASKANSSLVSSAIRLELTPQPITQGDECSVKKELSEIWWQGIDLTNPDIRFLPRLIPRLWDYLENLLCEGNYTKEEQDSVLSEYIQRLFNLPMHIDVKAFMINSLCNGFAESDYYLVTSTLKQLSENSICPAFNDPELKAKLILEAELMPGKKAFDFSFKPVGKRKSFKLSKSTSKYTLVVFWSVWCPHCIESIPQIYKTYKQYQSKGFDVLAISIDDKEDAFHDFIVQNRLDWKNIRIPYDSDSKVILKYNVDETPKMFLIDRKLDIVSRPSTPEHIRVFLEKHIQ